MNLKHSSSVPIVSFMNSYTQGKSGGDVAFIETFARLNNPNHTVITSYLGQELCKSMGLVALFKITTREHHFENVIKTYILRIFLGLIKTIFVGKPQIINVTSDALPDVIPAVFLYFRLWLLGGRPVFIQRSFHIVDRSRKLSYHMQQVGFWFIKRLAHRVITCSDKSKEDLLANGLPDELITVNYLGVDAEKIARAEVSKIAFDAIFLGRLVESKGVFDLVKIWLQVTRVLPTVRLGIIGAGASQMVDKLNQEIAELGLKSNINLLGFISDEQTYGLIKAAKLFVFTSHEEGFGIVLAEAMCAGAAVVAYNLPVYKTTFLPAICAIECFNISEFSSKICSLLQDDSLRTSFIQKGYALVKNYKWAEVTEREFRIIDATLLGERQNNV